MKDMDIIQIKFYFSFQIFVYNSFLYHKMQPNSPFGGLQKMACDFTTNTVMKATSKFVKGGPIPMSLINQSNTPSKSTTINRPGHARKLTNQSIPNQQNSTKDIETDKRKKPGLTRLDQLGKNVLFQGMDEPLSHSGRSKNSPLVQSLNSPSAETSKKQHKFNRSNRKQLLSSSKSKEKSFTSDFSKDGKKDQKNRVTSKNIVDKRNLINSKETSYSRIPANTHRASENDKPLLKHVKSAESFEEVQIQTPKGRKFERRGNQQEESNIKKVIKRGNFEEKNVECARHEKNKSKSIEKIQNQKKQSEIERQLKEQKEAEKLQKINERKRKIEEERRQKTPQPIQMPNRYGRKPVQPKNESADISIENPLGRFTQKEPVKKNQQIQKVSPQKKQQTPQPINRYGRKPVEQKQEVNVPENTNKQPYRYGRKVVQEPKQQQVKPPQNRYGRKNIPKQQQKVQPAKNEQQSVSEKPAINRYGRKPEQSLNEAKQTPSKPAQVKPINRYGRRQEKQQKQQVKSPETNVNKFQRKQPQPKQPQKKQVQSTPPPINNRYGRKQPQQQEEKKQEKQPQNKKIDQSNNRYGRKPEVVREPEQKPTSPVNRYGRKTEEPKQVKPPEVTPQINRYGRRQQQQQVKQVKQQTQTVNHYGRKPQSEIKEPEVKPVQPVNRYGRKQQEVKVPENKPTQPTNRYGRKPTQDTQEVKQPEPKPTQHVNRYGRKQQQEKQVKSPEVPPPVNRYGRKQQQTKEPQTKPVQPVNRIERKKPEEQIKQPIKQVSPVNRYGRKQEVKQPENKQIPEPANRYGRKQQQKEVQSPQVPPIVNRYGRKQQQEKKSEEKKQPEIKSARFGRDKQQIEEKKQLEQRPQLTNRYGRQANENIEQKKQIPKPFQRKEPERKIIQTPRNTNERKPFLKEQAKKDEKKVQKEDEVEKKCPRSNSIVYCVGKIFRINIKEEFLSIKNFSSSKRSVSVFSTILCQSLNSVFTNSSFREIEDSFNKIKAISNSILSKDLNNNAKKSQSYAEVSKNVLCYLLALINRNKLRECLSDLKKYSSKINNAKKGIEFIETLERKRLRNTFDYLKIEKTKRRLIKEYHLKQIFSISSQSFKALKQSAFSQIFNCSLKRAKNQQKIVQESVKQSPDLKNSRMSQQNTVLKPEKTSRSKTQTFNDQNTTILQKKVRQSKQGYEKQMNHLQFRVQELRQLISENKYQVQSKKKQNQELKQVSDKIGIQESQYIESDVYDSRETKLSYLLQVYIHLRNEDQEIIDINDLLNGQFISEGDEDSTTIKQWQIVHKNVQLKRVIDIYEGNPIKVKEVIAEQMREHETIKDFVKSYVQQKFLWEWAKKCLSV